MDREADRTARQACSRKGSLRITGPMGPVDGRKSGEDFGRGHPPQGGGPDTLSSAC